MEIFSNLATHASHGCYLLSGRPIEKLRFSGHPYNMVLLESNNLDYGAVFKDFKLIDTRNQKEFSSAAHLTKDIVVIAFICNHCPYVVRIIKEFSNLAKEDSPENMKFFALQNDFIFPYLFDQTQEVAKNFDAVCTPDIFVYKKLEAKYGLVYHARFEDLEKALNDLKDSDEVSFEQLPSAGCSIKWIS
jgi:thiol-disulfide isomerase/thioredoxin